MSAAIISEIALALIQVYLLAAKQAGLSEEQAKQEFGMVFSKFMVESSVPVDEVKED